MARERSAAGCRAPLLCESCGLEAEGGAVGWMALLGREDDDQVVVVLMCPQCVADEFNCD